MGDADHETNNIIVNYLMCIAGKLVVITLGEKKALRDLPKVTWIFLTKSGWHFCNNKIPPPPHKNSRCLIFYFILTTGG